MSLGSPGVFDSLKKSRKALLFLPFEVCLKKFPRRPIAAFAPLARRKIRSNDHLLLFLGTDSGKTVKNAVKS